MSELTFPARRTTVIDQLGALEITPPHGEPETIGEVLDRADVQTFRSPDELYDTLVTFVGDQYVGRKFYDDRGSNAGIDSEEVSL